MPRPPRKGAAAVGRCVALLTEVIRLSAASSSLSQVALGQHEEEYFSGPEPKAVLKKFREELADLEKEIEIRNTKLDMPYEYLRPSLVENSVAI